MSTRNLYESRALSFKLSNCTWAVSFRLYHIPCNLVDNGDECVLDISVRMCLSWRAVNISACLRRMVSIWETQIERFYIKNEIWLEWFFMWLCVLKYKQLCLGRVVYFYILSLYKPVTVKIKEIKGTFTGDLIEWVYSVFCKSKYLWLHWCYL